VFRFRLGPSSTPYGPSGGSNASLKWMGAFAVALLGVGVMAGWMLGKHQDKTGESFQDTGPIILQMQKLGQLHTASFHESDVLTQESEAQPNNWVKNIPGASGVVSWATHNQALVVADGTVEAGVDMTQIDAKSVEQVKQADGTSPRRRRPQGTSFRKPPRKPTFAVRPVPTPWRPFRRHSTRWASRTSSLRFRAEAESRMPPA
jgi:hypothetical protein